MPRNIPKSKAIAGLLPAMKWFKDNIFDAIEKGQTAAVAKRLAVAEHKARESGMCFTYSVERFDDDPGLTVAAWKPSDCGYDGPKADARPVGMWSGTVSENDNAAVRYGEAAAAADYFGDRPLRTRRKVR